MKTTKIRRELLDRLPAVHKAVAETLLKEGKWKLITESMEEEHEER